MFTTDVLVYLRTILSTVRQNTSELRHNHDLLHILQQEHAIIMTVADEIKALLADISSSTQAENDLLIAIETKMGGLNDAVGALQKQIEDLQANNNGAISATDAEDIKASLAELRDATNAQRVKEEIMVGVNVPNNPFPVDPAPVDAITPPADSVTDVMPGEGEGSEPTDPDDSP